MWPLLSGCQHCVFASVHAGGKCVGGAGTGGIEPVITMTAAQTSTMIAQAVQQALAASAAASAAAAATAPAPGVPQEQVGVKPAASGRNRGQSPQYTLTSRAPVHHNVRDHAKAQAANDRALMKTFKAALVRAALWSGWRLGMQAAHDALRQPGEAAESLARYFLAHNISQEEVRSCGRACEHACVRACVPVCVPVCLCASVCACVPLPRCIVAPDESCGWDGTDG